MSHASFRFNPYAIAFLNVKELLSRSRCYIWSLSDCNKIWTHNHLVCKRTHNYLPKLAKRLSCSVSTYLYGALWLYVIVISRTNFRVNPHSKTCLNVKEILSWSRRHFWSLSDSNEFRTHNDLVHKRTLNHLAKLAKRLRCVVSTYLYDASDCMLLLCHLRVSQWVYPLEFPECQGTSFLKQPPHLKFNWQQPDSNPQPVSSETNTQLFSQSAQMTELFCEYLSVRCITTVSYYHITYEF